jgi:hypothetical protein
MATIFKDGFKKDIAILLVVSIVCGAILANGVAYAANAYFGKTVAGLIGEYGEYDLTIQVREQMKTDVHTQLEKIIQEEFPGARLKEGPTLTGKTTYFIALPDKFKTQQIYEDIGKYFGSLPGGGSVGIMTEPKLTLRGVPVGAQSILLERISAMEGVRFTYRDGGSIGIVLQSISKSVEVSEQIKALLKEYQVVEIGFPVGMEPANPIKMGESIAKDFRNEAGLDYAQSVTMGGKNDEMTYMVSTMIELKRFLLAYATRMVITPTAGIDLLKGDTVVLQGLAAQPLREGTVLDKSNVVVQITAVRPDKTVEGMIIQGDAAEIQNLQAFTLHKEMVGSAVGTVSYTNPRQQLGTALGDTAKLLQQVPEMGKDVQQSTNIALQVLDNYDTTLAAVSGTRDAIQRAGGTIAAATAGLANINTVTLQSQLGRSAQALGGMAESLKILKLVQGDIGSTINGLEEARRNLNGLQTDLQALDHVAQDAERARTAIDAIVTSTDETLVKLGNFDAVSARGSLQNISQHIDSTNAMNLPGIALQLQYLGAAAPSLKDEEIAHSVSLLDKFIAGQVIPGERVQVLVNNGAGMKRLEPIIKKNVGHENISIYTTPVGIIEPDARGELFKVLGEVKAILAAIVAIVFTLATLMLDHTAVMSTMRRKRVVLAVEGRGWYVHVRRLRVSLSSPERVYGMAVGSGMLTTLFVLSGAAIPYVPFLCVPFAGGLLGLLIASKTETISPVRTEEVLAGEAMGMTYLQIMREIVIPDSRPGILQMLNKRKIEFI